MGQYQEWLLAQEIDKQLKTEVEALETEVLYLKDRITVLEQTVPETENVILQVLLAYLHDQTYGGVQGQNTASKLESATSTPEGWTRLPKLQTPPTSVAESVPSFPGMHSRLERLPGDALTLFEERRQSNSKLVPWLARKRRRENGNHLGDAEKHRQNENIRRWFERWSRDITSTAVSERQDAE